MKKAKRQIKRKGNQKTERSENKESQGLRDVLKRLFSHKLDKPSSTTDGELWMKIGR